MRKFIKPALYALALAAGIALGMMLGGCAAPSIKWQPIWTPGPSPTPAATRCAWAPGISPVGPEACTNGKAPPLP